MGAIVAPVQLKRIQSLVQTGVAEGAVGLPARSRAAQGRLLLPADPAQRRAADRDRDAGGDLRPGHRRHDLPHAGRGDRARQQHALRPRRQRVERDHRPRARRRAQAAGRRGVDQRHQPVRRGGRLRRLPRIRLRPRGRAGRLLRISEAQGLGEPQAAQGGGAAAAARPRPAASTRPRSTAPPSCSSAASRRGRTATIPASSSRPPASWWAKSAKATARTSATPSPPRAAPRLGRRATSHNRAQILYYIAENLSARARRVRRPHLRHDRRIVRESEGRGRGDHQPPVQLWRLGRQVSKARCIRRRCAAWRSR